MPRLWPWEAPGTRGTERRALQRQFGKRRPTTVRCARRQNAGGYRRQARMGEGDTEVTEAVIADLRRWLAARS